MEAASKLIGKKEAQQQPIVCNDAHSIFLMLPKRRGVEDTGEREGEKKVK